MMSDTALPSAAAAAGAVSSLLCGHQAEQRFLQQQWASGRLHHALLLEGEQGIGKATFAFHFAYHILASQESGQKQAEAAEWRKPEQDSPVWRKMEQDSHPNFLYIRRVADPKSQKLRNAVTVDDVRRVSRFLQQTASDSGWRVVIIDPADEMNRNAANAVLKTLEEPPVKTLFLLISHNPGRLLPTIRSRCQWVRLKPLPEVALRAALGAPQSADSIAAAGGSVGRALLLLRAGGGADSVKTAAELLEKPIFSVPLAQKLADGLNKRDNEAAYAVFLQYMLDFIHKQACQAAQAGRLPQAVRLAEFFTLQEQAMQEAAAFNLDKKHFILVLLRQVHDFLYQAGDIAAGGGR